MKFAVRYYTKTGNTKKLALAVAQALGVEALPISEPLTEPVDILRKTETGYDFYEVKNSPEVSEQFIRDAGFQNYIITRCGVKIDRIFIVTHGPDEDNPFVPVEITAKAKGYYRWVNDNIWNLNRLQKEKDEIRTLPGPQCENPYECWYIGYCRGTKKGDAQTSIDGLLT